MRVRELTNLIDASYRVVSSDRSYSSESPISEEIKNSVVSSIKVDNSGILIIKYKSKKTQSLEELGYSFETGI